MELYSKSLSRESKGSHPTPALLLYQLRYQILRMLQCGLASTLRLTHPSVSNSISSIPPGPSDVAQDQPVKVPAKMFKFGEEFRPCRLNKFRPLSESNDHNY